jgi:hypothetical protein
MIYQKSLIQEAFKILCNVPHFIRTIFATFYLIYLGTWIWDRFASVNAILETIPKNESGKLI